MGESHRLTEDGENAGSYRKPHRQPRGAGLSAVAPDGWCRPWRSAETTGLWLGATRARMEYDPLQEWRGARSISGMQQKFDLLGSILQ